MRTDNPVLIIRILPTGTTGLLFALFGECSSTTASNILASVVEPGAQTTGRNHEGRNSDLGDTQGIFTAWTFSECRKILAAHKKFARRVIYSSAEAPEEIDVKNDIMC